ncbi:MAG TPA: tetratricopeptide repeat protein, partial [Dongiaceae bacterium]|nr:tetratricopeptide repeat protein [Dongiaceae bacterium]
QTLARSGMNPGAMADFFEALQRSMRYSGEIPPEFLLTHPVTESRITDARARAAQLPAAPSSNSLEFALMKVRLSVLFARDSSATINDLLTQRKNSSEFVEVNEYGLTCAYAKANQLDEALTTVDGLLKRRPERITYIATKAEILNQSGRYKDAIKLLESALKYNPDNYVLTIHYTNALIKSKRANDAVDLLRYQLTQHESWPLLWSMLAEAYGKSDDRLGVYQARAEYYFLYGRTMTALEQLQYALPLAEKQFQVAAKINTRMDEMRASEMDMKL